MGALGIYEEAKPWANRELGSQISESALSVYPQWCQHVTKLIAQEQCLMLNKIKCKIL